MEITNKEINLVCAASALIGYIQALSIGSEITLNYMDRLNDYYIPNLQAAVEQYTGKIDLEDSE